jgi:hypothetical protein
VSRRLVALHSVLGGGEDIDTVWMVVREPELLAADPNDLMRRLMAMRVGARGAGRWAGKGVSACWQGDREGGDTGDAAAALHDTAHLRLA